MVVGPRRHERLAQSNTSLRHPVDRNMQQATVNLFADMGVQPFALLPELGLSVASKSTDTTAPTATITSPANGANLQDGATTTISGTASDVGGVVAGVEVSTDGGSTWHPATGTTSWTYAWDVHGSPTAKIKVRADRRQRQRRHARKTARRST